MEAPGRWLSLVFLLSLTAKQEQEPKSSASYNFYLWVRSVNDL